MLTGSHLHRVPAGMLAVMLACTLTLAHTTSAESVCHVVKLAELPITMHGLRATVPATINGQDAQFVVDSGLFYSIMSEAMAAHHGLQSQPAPGSLTVRGIGGVEGVRLVRVKQFGIAGAVIDDVEFLTAGGGTHRGSLLGQNFLQRFDVEYDLAGGAIRLFRTDHCEQTLLAYWLKSDQAYSTMHVERVVDASNAHTLGKAYLNGKEIRVAFDTGAPTSLLSTQAARRAGVNLDSDGVTAAGFTGGFGAGKIKTYIGHFASFKIGDGEEIKDTRLRFADVDLGSVDMLLGADFFVSHRIFVANREHRLYLSYNGRPVFDLSTLAGSLTE